ncbi:MAG: autotransporter assembly complex family protein [Pseudomonadota bacterium]
MKYRLSGVDGELERNIEAHLGDLPEDEDERDNFVFSAEAHVKRGLQALGFYRPRIDIQLNRERPVWRMAIRVEPGAPVLLRDVDIQISGEAHTDDAFKRLLADVPLRVGERLHHGYYEDFKVRLQGLGQRRGYLQAELARNQVLVDIDDSSARIELHYDSGPRYRVGDITYDDVGLDRELLLKMQTFQRGDPVDLDELRAFQAALQRSAYFGNSLVRPERPDHEARLLPVHVEMSASARHTFRTGVGFSTDTEERVSIAWATPLINRYGHRQETRYEYSPIRPRGSINYSIPLGHPIDDVLILRARRESNEYGDLESTLSGAGVLRERRRGQWLTTTSLRYLDEAWDVGPDSRRNSYTLPGLAFSRRFSRGNELDPPRGFSQYYQAEFASAEAGSDIDLLRLNAVLRHVMTPLERHRLVTRLELGAIIFDEDDRADLSPSLSFFAGGNHSIRGYDYQTLGPEIEVATAGGETRTLTVGGDRLAVGSVEYQYYLRPDWRLALFVDGGNAFDGSDFEAEAGAGFGLHLISPVGPLRLDLAKSVTETDRGWRIHLNLGAEF